MKNLLLLAALLPVAAFAQQWQSLTPTQQQAVLNAVQHSADPANGDIPGSCNSPMAMQQMMSALQADVGNRISDQLVNIVNPRVVFIKKDSYACRIVTVWGTHPAVEGVFKLYHNAEGRVVYSWVGEKVVPTP